ncbi:hypothetical protein ACFQXB_14460 [Plastorhodobacter daqingensis]|uniref:Uncharacterized protein n=1 Tax=Plastorhodobacter daqingensis TaxID=1387281 RepID=A0ABW2UN52_9RHOB
MQLERGLLAKLTDDAAAQLQNLRFKAAGLVEPPPESPDSDRLCQETAVNSEMC